MSGLTIGVLAGAMLVTALPAQAQDANAPSPGRRAQQYQARFQIAAMEGVLERAVMLGAQNVRVQVQAIAPELLVINGAARARGFWLDGYGVFFDVDVPPMRRGLMWSFQMLNYGGRPGVDGALRSLRREAESIENPAIAARLRQAIGRLEQEMGPLPASSRGAAERAARADTSLPVTRADDSNPGTPPPAAPEPRPELTPGQVAILEDPGIVYTTEVKNALIEAMIEYSAPIPLAADEWLTIAARDREGSRVQAGAPYEVSTLLLRIRGEDLAAYRAGHIDGREVRTRVEIKEY